MSGARDIAFGLFGGRSVEQPIFMNVTIQIPATLRDCCKGSRELKLQAATVGGALQQLELSHPALYRSVCDETGAVRRHVHVFVNSSLVHGQAGLETPLVAGDVVTIMPAVSGG
jgi:MoaD family protein